MWLSGGGIGDGGDDGRGLGEGGGESGGGDGAGRSMIEAASPLMSIPVKSASELPDKMSSPIRKYTLAPCCTPPHKSAISVGQWNVTLGFELRENSPTAPQTNMATVSKPVGQWNVTCVGSIRRKTHAALPRHTANSEHTIGAMEI